MSARAQVGYQRWKYLSDQYNKLIDDGDEKGMFNMQYQAREFGSQDVWPLYDGAYLSMKLDDLFHQPTRAPFPAFEPQQFEKLSFSYDIGQLAKKGRVAQLEEIKRQMSTGGGKQDLAERYGSVPKDSKKLEKMIIKAREVRDIERQKLKAKEDAEAAKKQAHTDKAIAKYAKRMDTLYYKSFTRLFEHAKKKERIYTPSVTITHKSAKMAALLDEIAQHNRGVQFWAELAAEKEQERLAEQKRLDDEAEAKRLQEEEAQKLSAEAEAIIQGDNPVNDGAHELDEIDKLFEARDNAPVKKVALRQLGKRSGIKFTVPAFKLLKPRGQRKQVELKKSESVHKVLGHHFIVPESLDFYEMKDEINRQIRLMDDLTFRDFAKQADIRNKEIANMKVHGVESRNWTTLDDSAYETILERRTGKKRLAKQHRKEVVIDMTEEEPEPEEEEKQNEVEYRIEDEYESGPDILDRDGEITMANVSGPDEYNEVTMANLSGPETNDTDSQRNNQQDDEEEEESIKQTPILQLWRESKPYKSQLLGIEVNLADDISERQRFIDIQMQNLTPQEFREYKVAIGNASKAAASLFSKKGQRTDFTVVDEMIERALFKRAWPKENNMEEIHKNMMTYEYGSRHGKDIYVNSKSASKPNSKPQSKQPSKPPSKVQSKAPSKVQSKAPSEVQSKAPSKVQSKAPSKVQSKAPSKVQSKAPSKAQSRQQSPPQESEQELPQRQEPDPEEIAQKLQNIKQRKPPKEKPEPKPKSPRVRKEKPAPQPEEEDKYDYQGPKIPENSFKDHGKQLRSTQAMNPKYAKVFAPEYIRRMEEKGFDSLHPNPPASVFGDKTVKNIIKRGLQVAAGYTTNRDGKPVSQETRTDIREQIADYNRSQASQTVNLSRIVTKVGDVLPKEMTIKMKYALSDAKKRLNALTQIQNEADESAQRRNEMYDIGKPKGIGKRRPWELPMKRPKV